MKKYISILTFILVALVCSAATKVILYDAIDFSGNLASVTTNGNEATVTRTKVSGQVMSLSLDIVGITPTVTVSVATTADTGSSIGASKVIYSATLSADVNTNFWDSAQFLWNDTLSVTVTNASTNATTVEALLIIKE